ncbi:aluminum-activated malate transporter 9-like [Coffea eugenioides]|uniref:aluminum-activated malate transporter 9-like n=1 Tax=Coffea eugenioides TaxID=49369 RepID=UPI000F613843|nr:aluminum-activated malate transporter 9-like [Coffea eugenioides]
MNGKNGSIEINIPQVSKVIFHDAEKSSGLSCRGWIMEVWKFCKEDTNRIIFALKVGLAVLLVSLLILIRAPYHVFGSNIIWSILTVAIMFEYTVGSTFNRGFNRALGSLLAGVLAIVVAQIALNTGPVAEPIIIGISIFLVGAITSFMKFWPPLAPYEYGFRVILFTYCLIIVSGYRMGNPIRTSMDRLYSIAIGGIVAVSVNVLIFPIWAGEQLHQELVTNFKSVADALEECVKKYLEDDGSNHPEFSSTVMDDFPDEPAYKKCRSTLSSSAKLESLANSAKWEPPHGRFSHFFYPWSEYVKVSAVLRYCAYEVMALHGVLHSEIQAPYNLRITFQQEIQDATTEAAELVRCLGNDIRDMQKGLKAPILKKVHATTERLQRAIDMHSYLLISTYDQPPDRQLPKLSHTLSANLSDFSNQMAEIDVTLRDEQNLNIPPSQPLGSFPPAQTESYHESMRKHSRRLHSWPSREVDAFEEEGGNSADFVPKMQALESTAHLSLATFTSLLVEFVARLDHLVEAVDDLSKMAKFKIQTA